MNFGRFGKIASVSLIGAMLLAGCSGNGQTVMKIGDTNITEGAVNFFANYGMGTEDVDAAVDNLKKEYLLKEVAKAMDITLTDDEAKQVKSTISNFKAQQGGKKAGDKLLKKYGVDDDIIETIISASMQPASAQWICCSPTAALVFMQIGGQCSMAQSCWC